MGPGGLRKCPGNRGAVGLPYSDGAPNPLPSRPLFRCATRNSCQTGKVWRGQKPRAQRQEGFAAHNPNLGGSLRVSGPAVKTKPILYGFSGPRRVAAKLARSLPGHSCGDHLRLPRRPGKTRKVSAWFPGRLPKPVHYPLGLPRYSSSESPRSATSARAACTGPLPGAPASIPRPRPLPAPAPARYGTWILRLRG